MKTILRQVRYLDHENQREKQGNLVMENGKISGFTGEEISEAHQVVEGKGKWVLPGFIDLHVHFREPGGEAKETLESGANAAIAGGYTTVVCMPNTQPVMDNRRVLAPLIGMAEHLPCQVLFMGAVTRGLQGREMVNFSEYNNPATVGVTDDGRPVSDASIMLKALMEGKERGLLVANHCEDESLMFDRSVNRGEVSKKLGLEGVPSLAEELMIQRDLYLAKASGCPVHLQHVSSAASVEMIRHAKESGVQVTAEATPHHFSLTEDEVLTRGSMAKMSPPLRKAQDVLAIGKGLADGTLDCIATDHAPHLRGDKTPDLVGSANGIIGLETSFGVSVTYLLSPGRLQLAQLIRRLSTRPAEILGLSSKGELKPGNDADLVLADLEETWIVSPDSFASKSRNTPFEGVELKGRVLMTMVGGAISYSRDEAFR